MLSTSNIKHSLQKYMDIGNALPKRNYSRIKHAKRKEVPHCSEKDLQIVTSMVGD